MIRRTGLPKPMQSWHFWPSDDRRPGRALAQADIATYQGADRTQKLLEGAKKEGTLTIYTSATVDDMTALTTAFEKKYGIKPQVWRASSENIIQRASTEARGGRFDVDVFETDGVAMEAIHREKLLQVVKTPRSERSHSGGDPAARGMDRRPRADFHRRLQHRPDQEGRPARRPTRTSPIRNGRASSASRPPTTTGCRPSSPSMGEEKGLKLFRDIVAKNGLSVRKGHTLLANLVVSGEVPLALTTYLYKVRAAEEPTARRSTGSRCRRRSRARRAPAWRARRRTPTPRCCSWISC